MRFARKELQPRRARLQGRERLGRRGDARQRDEPELRRPLDHGMIGVGRDHEFRARFRDLVDLARFKHRACADQDLVAEQARDDLDARRADRAN